MRFAHVSAIGLALGGLALISCTHAPHSASTVAKAPRLLLISVDGMRPAFYQNPAYRKAAPTLASLADQGEASARGIQPVFPSITYPDHASMVTGAYSAEHGIYNNRIFSPTDGPTEQWYWYERDIQLPTLWQKAEEAGLKTAIIRWPSSVGARVHWSIPEIFAGLHGFDADADWALVQKNTDPGFLKKVLALGAIQKPTSIADFDQIDTQGVEYLLENEDPDLILLHLINLDHIQHQVGTESPEVTKVLSEIDTHLRQIISHLDPKKTTVIVTGDHGFASYTKRIHLGSLIHSAGLDNQVFSQSDGGQAVLYAQPGAPRRKTFISLCDQLMRAAHDQGATQVQEVSREKLAELHSYPGALCALEAGIGTVFVDQTDDVILEKLHEVRGHHGYLPSRPEMRAGFLIWGKGTSHHPLQGDLKMPDIAPTAAEILGISFPVPAGRRIVF